LNSNRILKDGHFLSASISIFFRNQYSTLCWL
jgi:hypothetical protein